MFCPNCHKEINGNAYFCKHCGAPLQGDQTVAQLDQAFDQGSYTVPLKPNEQGNTVSLGSNGQNPFATPLPSYGQGSYGQPYDQTSNTMPWNPNEQQVFGQGYNDPSYGQIRRTDGMPVAGGFPELNREKENSGKHMLWHKAQVFFFLWLTAIVQLFIAIRSLTQKSLVSINGEDTTEEFLELYPATKTLLLVAGIAALAACVALAFSAIMLLLRSKIGPGALYGTIGLNIFSIAFSVHAAFSVFRMFLESSELAEKEEIIKRFFPLSWAGVAFVCIVGALFLTSQIIYYNKRKALFN